MPILFCATRTGFLLVILTLFTRTNGQTVINSTGNTLKNNSYHFEYSIGEIAITSISNQNNSATQGLLQPTIKEFKVHAFLSRDLIFEKVKRSLFNANIQFTSIANNNPIYVTNRSLKKHYSF